MRIRSPARAAWAVPLLLAVALAGCASAFHLETPKLSVLSMKVQSADIFSQRLQMRMLVQNPNDRDLPIKGITYRIDVNDAFLAKVVPPILANTPSLKVDDPSNLLESYLTINRELLGPALSSRNSRTAADVVSSTASSFSQP